MRDTTLSDPAIAKLRHELVQHGFFVANGARELQFLDLSRDINRWVATNYAGGEYEVTVWDRDGAKQVHRRVVRVNDQLLVEDPLHIETIQRWLLNFTDHEPYQGLGARA